MKIWANARWGICLDRLLILFYCVTHCDILSLNLSRNVFGWVHRLYIIFYCWLTMVKVHFYNYFFSPTFRIIHEFTIATSVHRQMKCNITNESKHCSHNDCISKQIWLGWLYRLCSLWVLTRSHLRSCLHFHASHRFFIFILQNVICI